MHKDVIVSLSLQAVLLTVAGSLIVYSIKESKRIDAYNAEVRRNNEEIRIWNAKFGTK